MENNNLGLLIGAFIIILVGVVLINSTADSVAELDDTLTIANNESITWAGNNTLITLANDDIVTNSEIVYNQSHKLTRATDYTMTRSSITFHNVSTDSSIGHDSGDITANVLNITYTHEGDNYLSDSTSRTLINLVVLFFALAILAVGYHIVTKAFENMGF